MRLDLGNGFELRHARASDRDALCRVCLMTGDAGQDASGREDDPDLVGMVFAVPYVVLEPDFAYAVEGQSGVCGYLFGAPDTVSFNERFEREWLPALQQKVRKSGCEQSHWQGSDWVRHLIHHPPTNFPPALHPYPAHAHIDLLPEARGCSIGRKGMTHICERLAAAGATGVHLQVNPRNIGAQAFYEKLGFAPLADPSLPHDTTFMVKRLP